MKTLLQVTLIVVVFVSASGCKKKGSSPTGPSNTNSTWTGTLTRPNGLGTIAASWNATTDSNGAISGPLTLTYKGVSVVIPTAHASTAGNSSQGYTIHVDFQATSGQLPAFPSCSINGASLASGGGDPFPSPYNSINAAMDVFINNCTAFIDSAQSARETQQLSLTK